MNNKFYDTSQILNEISLKKATSATIRNSWRRMKPIEQIGAFMPSSIIQGAVWGKHLASNLKSKQGMKRLGKMYLKTGSKILNKFKK